MNSKIKVELPRYEISIEGKKTGSFSPRKETDFIVPASKIIDGLSSEFLTSTNAFSLMKNDRLQVYKFCQCKNGTHQIKTSFDEDAFIFVDCNEMKVFNPLGIMGIKDVIEEEVLMSDTIEMNVDDDIYQEQVQTKSQNGFFLKKLFNLSNSAIGISEKFNKRILGILFGHVFLLSYIF